MEKLKLKIGLFNESFPPTIDGVSNTVYNYAVNLKKNHCDCTVVTPKYPNVTDDYDFEVYRYQSFEMTKKLGYRVGNVLSPKMLYDLRKQHFDIIHIHSPFASSVIASELLKVGYKMPVIITYHTKYDVDIEARVKSKAMRSVSMKFLKHNLNKATEVWSVTSGAVENLRQNGYKGRCLVMQNGTDFPKGRADENTCDRLRTRFLIKDDCPTLLFVGRMMWYKNTKIIFDALKTLKGDFQLIMVGDGADRAAMEQYVRDIGLSEKVIFTGAVYDREVVRAFFSIADLFLFPSTYDTSGLVVKEAAACSLPSLVVADSCPSEGIIHGENGFLCHENSVSMSKTLEKILNHPKLIKTVGENAADTVYLSWKDSVARAYSRYCQVASEWDKPLPYQYR